MDKKYGFFTCYGMLWKRAFDYKGTSGLREFWFPFIVNSVIAVIAGILITISAVAEVIPLAVAGLILLAYDLVCIVPFISLTVRRLKDTGRSGWLSLLALIFGVGTIIVLILCACASIYVVTANQNACIYGPPQMIIDDEDDDNDGDDEEDINFDPSQNWEVDIYGPPEMFDEEDDEDDEDYEIEYNPSVNEEICIYGPPEMFEDNDASDDTSGSSSDSGKSKAEQYRDQKNAKTEEADKDDINASQDDDEIGITFNPSINEEICIYGPPEMLEEKNKGDN